MDIQQVLLLTHEGPIHNEKGRRLKAVVTFRRDLCTGVRGHGSIVSPVGGCAMTRMQPLIRLDAGSGWIVQNQPGDFRDFRRGAGAASDGLGQS